MSLETAKNPLEAYAGTENLIDRTAEEAAVVEDGEAKKPAKAEVAKEAAKKEDPTVEEDAEAADSEDESDDEDESEEAATEEDADDEESDDSDAEDAATDKKVPKEKYSKAVRRRIAKAVAKQRAAEARAVDADARTAAVEARMAALEARATPPAKDAADTKVTKEPGRPDPNDFEYGEIDEKYQDALAEFLVDKKFAKKEAEAEAKRSAEAANQEKAEHEKKGSLTLQAGAAKYDDFEEKVIDGAATEEWPLSKELASLCFDSDVGADILYHLASNPKEARSIFSKSPMGQAAYFGRMEARFSEKKTEKKEPKAPKAPEPVKQPRGSGGQFDADPLTADFPKFLEMWNRKSRR